MLNAETLRSTLKEIFGVEDKYLVPLDEGWYVPTYDKSDKIGTWIGYRILSKKPNVRGYQDSIAGTQQRLKPIKVTFRISFVGPQAEELADMTLLWDDRQDVQEAFGKQNAQLNYIRRQQFSYPIKNGGLNDNLCWCVDFEAQTFYVTEFKYELWNLKRVDLGGKVIIPNKEDKNGD